MYDEAKAYFQTNGNLVVPRNRQTAGGYNLNLWLSRMKREKDRLSDGQISSLSEIGMKWTSGEQRETAR